MPDLKNAAEVGSNMNGCLIWAIIGFFVFVGMSVSPYMVFVGLLVGGAMLGGKAMAGNKKDSSKQVSSTNSNKSYSFEDRKALISDLSDHSDKSVSTQSGHDSNYMKRDVNQSSFGSVGQATNNQTFTQSSGVDLVEQLEKLAELKKKGYLSDEEYSSMKANVLSQPISNDKTVDFLINHSNPDAQNSTSESHRKSNFSADDLI